MCKTLYVAAVQVVQTRALGMLAGQQADRGAALDFALVTDMWGDAYDTDKSASFFKSQGVQPIVVTCHSTSVIILELQPLAGFLT